MWGTPNPSRFEVTATRFIPTHVGNTQPAPEKVQLRPVHPHACGEHRSKSKGVSPPAGSSPRMWGTPQMTLAKPILIRFIPTHVGNTSVFRFFTGSYSVHPHACGEHALAGWANMALIGSSPRMWGTQCSRSKPWPYRRFIPTHVGNTGCAGLTQPACCGSSPRMWGTLARRCLRVQNRRFIPTHVGNTSDAGAAVYLLTVHPHACGEHMHPSRAWAWKNGSSPRMWGTR